MLDYGSEYVKSRMREICTSGSVRGTPGDWRALPRQQDFLKCSYGYRPKVGAQKAVKEMTKELMYKYGYVVEADIRSFFGAPG
jgi:hypothetical protein